MIHTYLTMTTMLNKIVTKLYETQAAIKNKFGLT